MIETIIIPAIIYLSLGLSSLSVCIFIFLIFMRIFRFKKEKYRKNRAKSFEQVLLIHLQRPLQDAEPILLQTEEDKVLMINAALNIAHIAQGDLHKKLQQILKDLGLYDWAWVQVGHQTKKRSLLLAVRLLLTNPENAEDVRLLKLVADKNVLRRRSIIKALAFTGRGNFLPVFLDYIHHHDDISAPYIGSAFEKFGLNILPTLVDFLTVENPPMHVKIGALIAFGRMAHAEEVLRIVLPYCHHPHASLRRAAYEALAELQVPVPLPVLIKGAHDDRWQIRRSVALVAVYASPFPAALIYRLLRDEHVFVALSADAALQKMQGMGEGLIKALAQHENKKYAKRGAYFLGRFSEQSAHIGTTE